jgi:predicted DNA-binding transcriptional regulator AlpA
MSENWLTRKRVAQRYAVARNTMYNWVARGAFPDAHRRHGSYIRWNEEKLLVWELSHLHDLTCLGVDMDRLPPFIEAAKRLDSKRDARAAAGQAERSCRDVAIEALVALSRARDVLLKGAAKNRPLTANERKEAARWIRHVSQFLAKGATGKRSRRRK